MTADDWNFRLAAVLAALLFLAACGGTGLDRPRGQSNCPDCTPTPDDPDNSDDDGDSKPDDDSPGETNPTYCAPTPSGFQVDRPPELPETIRRKQCPLRREREKLHDGNYTETRTFEVEKNGRLVRKITSSQGVVSRRTEWRLDGAGSVTSVQTIHLRPGSGDRTEWYWTLDGADRVKRFRNIRREVAGNRSTTTDRTIRRRWRDGRPTETIVETDTDGTTDTIRVRWFYTDGRLMRATLRGDTRPKTVRWFYQKGRPVRVVRRLAGDVYERQTWQYDEDGRLERRSLETSGRGLERSLAESADPYETELDSLAARTTNGAGPETFGKQPDRRNCEQLPSSVGFGYPADHPAYRFGWRNATDPRHIASIYRWAPFAGAPRYFDAYGHATAVPDVAAIEKWFEAEARLESRVDYDDRGRPTRVEMSGRSADGAEEIRAVRNRVFRDDRLVDDVLRVDDGAERQVRRLTFRWRDDRLRRRTLRVEGRVVEYQTWRHRNDNESKLRLYRKRDLSLRPTPSAGPILEVTESSNADEADLDAKFVRVTDERGRVVKRVSPIYNGGGRNRPRVYETTATEYGPHGPVKREEETGGRVTTKRWTYTDDGRKQTRTVERPEDVGTPDETTRWQWRDGRLASKVTTTSEGSRAKVVTRTYRCSDGG